MRESSGVGVARLVLLLFLFLFVELPIVLDSGVLVLLVLRHQISHVRFSLHVAITMQNSITL